MFAFLTKLFRPKSPMNNATTPPMHPDAIALILDFEGMDQPSKWPKGESGITLGRGYDLGYTTAAEFRRDWSPHLPNYAIDLLTSAIGVKAHHAEAIASRFGNITISAAAADAVFTNATLPKWIATTKKTFPGSEKLPPKAFGALVSLTFNRGPSLAGPRRLEMRQIFDHLEDFAACQMSTADTLRAIAHSIKLMQRIWPDLPGLQRRRRAESELVLSAL